MIASQPQTVMQSHIPGLNGYRRHWLSWLGFHTMAVSNHKRLTASVTLQRKAVGTISLASKGDTHILPVINATYIGAIQHAVHKMNRQGD
jgi:hypothetical protein